MQKENKFHFDIISKASHKIGSLLTIAKEGVSLVSTEAIGKINNDQMRSLLISARAINRLTRLISDLIDIEKVINGKIKFRKEKVNVYELINYIVNSIQQEKEIKNISLENRLSDTLAPIYVDRDKTFRALLNLIEYLIKFSSEGSRIYISGSENTNTGFIEISIKSSSTIKSFVNYEDLLSIDNNMEDLFKEENISLNIIVAKVLMEHQGGKIGLLSLKENKGEAILSIPKYMQ